MKSKYWLVIFSVLLTMFLLMPCTVSAQWDPSDEDETETEEADDDLQPDEETLQSWPFSEDIYGTVPYISSLEPEGRVWHGSEEGDLRFVSGNEYGMSVMDGDDAYSLGLNYLDTDVFDLLELRTDAYGDIYVYTFQQVYGDELLRNCYLKVITDTEGNVLGVSSSLVDSPDDARWDYPDSPEETGWEERFADWDSEYYEKTVKAHSGEMVDVSIPVLIDPYTGERYLGDKDLMVFCVHVSDLEDLDDRRDAMPINMDRDLYSDGELLSYFRFIQVYDYFAEKGWWGPDGMKNPCMLQFDTSGENRGNASYASFQEGFHIFNFSVDDGAGQSLQVIAHEFTHGVSATNHVGIYQNETGALDEALSDLIGNAVEADIRQWEITDNGWLLSFRKAHADEYTLYVWDEFYTPPSDYPDSWNDLGDVHHNAFVVSPLVWRMYEAGMTAREIFDYWFTFDLTITPKTDYAETGAKAAWCAEIAGLSEYAPVMQQAAEDLRLTDKSLPENMKAHQGMVMFENPLDEKNVKAEFCDPWSRDVFITWPIAGTDTIAAVFAEMSYWMVSVQSVEGDSVAFWNGIENAWEMVDAEKLAEYYATFESDYCVRVDGGTITKVGY